MSGFKFHCTNNKGGFAGLAASSASCKDTLANIMSDIYQQINKTNNKLHMLILYAFKRCREYHSNFSFNTAPPRPPLQISSASEWSLTSQFTGSIRRKQVPWMLRWTCVLCIMTPFIHFGSCTIYRENIVITIAPGRQEWFCAQCSNSGGGSIHLHFDRASMEQ